MTIRRFHRWARAIVYAVAALLFALSTAGCKSSESFAIAKFQAQNTAESNEAPTVLGRFDGDLFVGWAVTYAVASIEPKGGGIPFYYVTLPAGRMVVYQRSDKFKWDGKFPGVLPLRAAALFTADEITRWGLSFSDPGPVVTPGDTVPSPNAQ